MDAEHRRNDLLHPHGLHHGAFRAFKLCQRDFAFSKLGASKANVYSNLIPVFTAIFSYLLAIEEMTAFKIIGIFVVVIGLVLSQLKTKKAATE